MYQVLAAFGFLSHKREASRLWTGFSFLSRRSASFLSRRSASFLSRRSASFLSRRSASFLYVTALRFCHVWVFLSFLRRWARPEALIAKLVYIGEINAGQMRLNTYSKTADSAYRDYRASQRAAARRVSLILSGFSISLPVSNSRSYIIQVRRYCESIVSQASGGSGCAPSFQWESCRGELWESALNLWSEEWLSAERLLLLS